MVYGINEIMEMLPHRYPFLLVDSILEVNKGKSIVGQKNVTINEPFFQGHFPGHPIMPGVLIVEAMAQAGGILGMASISETGENVRMFFMGIDQAKFRKPVVPGDQLILEVEVLKTRSRIFKLAGQAKVDGHLVTEAQLLASIEEKK